MRRVILVLIGFFCYLSVLSNFVLLLILRVSVLCCCLSFSYHPLQVLSIEWVGMLVLAARC